MEAYWLNSITGLNGCHASHELTGLLPIVSMSIPDLSAQPKTGPMIQGFCFGGWVLVSPFFLSFFIIYIQEAVLNHQAKHEGQSVQTQNEYTALLFNKIQTCLSWACSEAQLDPVMYVRFEI